MFPYAFLFLCHLQLFTNSAAALPAEVGPDGEMKPSVRRGLQFPGLSQASQAWKRRMEATAERRRREAESRQ